MSVKHNKGNNRMSDIGNNTVLPTTVTRASGLTASGLAASGQAASGLTASGLAASGPVASGPVASGRAAFGEQEGEDYQEKRLKTNQGQSVQQDRRIAKSYRGSGEDCTGAVGEVRKGVG
jgi:2-methylcitrate dehydratase PrpD